MHTRGAEMQDAPRTGSEQLFARGNEHGSVTVDPREVGAGEISCASRAADGTAPPPANFEMLLLYVHFADTVAGVGSGDEQVAGKIDADGGCGDFSVVACPPSPVSP